MFYEEVLNFWFKELEPKQWWVKDLKLDNIIKDRFLSILNQAKKSELYTWRETAKGRLAEIIVLDQFSRNIYRNLPESFEADPLALALSQEAVSLNADKNLTSNEQSFLYMPYMHSESKLIHEEAVQLYSKPGLEFNLDFEYKHKKIIDRFNRYPHRNKILNRVSTPEEIEFLKSPNSSF